MHGVPVLRDRCRRPEQWRPAPVLTKPWWGQRSARVGGCCGWGEVRRAAWRKKNLCFYSSMRLLREAEGERSGGSRRGRGGACREDALGGTEVASGVKRRRAGCW
jgi:hypothetical protein